MFFVFTTASDEDNEEERIKIAMFEVSTVELLLYLITTLAVGVAMLRMRKLKYDRKIGSEGTSGIGLDNTLLVVAQTGMFIYCMFSIIGCYFTLASNNAIELVAEIFSFIQTCLQTMFVLDGWWRKCRNIEQTRTKPGREIITFLIVANMAMWIINILEKNRAEFRPTHLHFFGDWAWTIITHISMPMAIFYRFHSTICLFEIWKSAYKVAIVSQNIKNFQFYSSEELSFTISAFYAKILVILGIALPITDAIATEDFDYYDGFYIYLYIGSILFLFYMYMIHLKEKSSHEGSRHPISEGNSGSSECCPSKGNSYIRYGSFYFRLGVTGFGIGSVIYSSLQFGQYWEFSADHECDNWMNACKPLMRIIFVLLQMLFIFSHSNFLDVQKSKLIAKFGLMHMIATNLAEWFLVLVEETRQDIYMSTKMMAACLKPNISRQMNEQFIGSKSFQITYNLYDHKLKCLKSDIMQTILLKAEPYLAPCTVEYNLLSVVILLLMWKNNCTNHHSDGSASEQRHLSDREKHQRGNLMYSHRSQSHFSVDCAQAHKGLFGGLMALAVTIISLIMFFELVTHQERKDAAILQVNVWEAFLFVAGTIAVIFCIAALRDVELCKKKNDLELEHLLLLVTQWGVYMYFLFQIIGDAWGRRCKTEQQMRKKPGRQLVTFLLVVNIALWVVNRLKNNRSVSHPNQMDFYGVLAWNIITHVSMPLVVSYRFQSTVCFYEIWKCVYKYSNIKKKGDSITKI
nr:unnamed protein product [Callosobruchus analis]